jgi:hypothetical protein
LVFLTELIHLKTVDILRLTFFQNPLDLLVESSLSTPFSRGDNPSGHKVNFFEKWQTSSSIVKEGAEADSVGQASSLSAQAGTPALP